MGPSGRDDGSREGGGQSDVGVIMYRQLLAEQIDRVEQGLDPSMGIFRDPLQNQCIVIPENPHAFNGLQRMPDSERIQKPWAVDRFDPELPELVAYLRDREQRIAAGELAAPPEEIPIIPVGYRQHKSVQILPPC